LVEWSSGKLLLDCGSGVVHGLARDGRHWRAITHVAISHFHTDHFGDLPALLWAWKHGVPVEKRGERVLLGPVGMNRILHALAAAYGEHILDPGPPVKVVELDSGGHWEDPAHGLVIRCHSAHHTPEALSLLVEVEGVAIGYTGDTGAHPGHADFFRAVPLLLCECGVPDGSAIETHHSPSSAARLAVDANPGQLVLTHVHPEIDRGGLARHVRSLGYSGVVRVGEDGTRIRLAVRRRAGG
jgi:ribonuclease BN (tRNA processing enzyme)